MNKIVNIIEFVYNNGMTGFAKESYLRLSDYCYEKYLNVDTKGMESKEDLKLTDPDWHEYATVFYKHIFDALNKLPVDRSESTLLDYGCGKGRFLIAAATCPYKKIIGVELSSLIDLAKKNLDRMKNKNTSLIRLERCNAINFPVPLDVNIIYFFNPFRGSVLESVVNNIRASYDYAPRKIYIIYFNNDHFDELIADHDWLSKISQSEVHRRISCGIYETR